LNKEYYAPPHGKPCTYVSGTIKANMEKIEEIENTILQNIGKSAEEILSELLTASDPAEYFYLLSFIFIFISYAGLL